MEGAAATSGSGEQGSRFRRVCVFCGSSSGKRSSYRDAAVELGKELVARKVDLVYGGGSLGLMGEVSEAVHKGGGHRDPDDSDGQGADRRDGGRGARRGGHAPAQGRDGAQLRRLHRAPRRVRDAGRAPGGDRVGPARHPQQAGGPAERGRLLQPAAGVHRQGGGRRLHQARAAPHLRQRAARQGPRPEARGVRAGAGRGPRDAQAVLGDRAGRLQLRPAGRDCSLMR